MAAPFSVRNAIANFSSSFSEHAVNTCFAVTTANISGVPTKKPVPRISAIGCSGLYRMIGTMDLVGCSSVVMASLGPLEC